MNDTIDVKYHNWTKTTQAPDAWISHFRSLAPAGCKQIIASQITKHCFRVRFLQHNRKVTAFHAWEEVASGFYEVVEKADGFEVVERN